MLGGLLFSWTVMLVLKAVLLTLHLLSAGGWFGAMCYSLLVLQPRAKRYFKSSGSEFEEFIATVSQGARWKVIGALAVMALSGLALAYVDASPSRVWQTLIGLKGVLFLLALGIFVYASWRLWPLRIFASDGEIPGIQRQFRRVGICLTLTASVVFALGVLARLCN